MDKQKNTFTYISLIALSIAAAILYNSWPLGIFLNPKVSRVSLASGLEAVGQPYNWLFIGGDVLSSLIIILVSIILINNRTISKSFKSIKLALVFVILFGAGTIIDALEPLRCVQGIQTCPSFTQDHILLTHGIFSIAASIFLFMSLCILWFHQRYNGILIGFLIGYFFFGLVSLIQAIVPGRNGNWSQDYYITMCSLWIAVIPYIVYLCIYKEQNKHV